MCASPRPRYSGQVTAEEVLEEIRGRPKGRAGYKQLARELGLRAEQRKELEASLAELVADGRLIETRRGHYRVPEKETGLLEGRFSAHRSGFGFVTLVRPLPGVDGDLYIGKRDTQNAMQGDRVLVEVAYKRSDGRAVGRVKRILHRENQTVVGVFHYDARGSAVTPYDDRIGGEVEILRGQELPSEDLAEERLGDVTAVVYETAKDLDGLVVNVELTDFPSRYQPARGRVIEVLGREDDFGVDVEVVIRKHHVPHRFPAEATAEAEAVEETIDAEEIERRRDFRDLPIVTIDGETARDFDDAVYVEQLPTGAFRLDVHIADVSHYVEPGSALDDEARVRGNSTYFPDRAVPMLPGRLSTGVCSLNPKVDRLAMSALMEISPQGQITKAEFCRGVIRSAERMTYTDVHRILDGDEQARTQYAELVPRFETMRDLAKILIARRTKRGAIDLNLPEAEILFDEQHQMTGVKKAERTFAHRIIEEFMLAANESVAEYLEKAGFGFLHRVHEPPSGKGLREFEEIARRFGQSLGVDLPAPKTFHRHRRHRDGTKRNRETRAENQTAIRAKDLQKFLKKIAGKPEERVLSYRLLRAMKQARYSEENKGHFALATEHYAHFTSPIRRYPDLIVHRVLKAVLDGEKAARPTSPYAREESRQAGPYPTPELAELADQTSMTERRSSDAERELMNWKKAKYMEQRLGDEFEGMITGLTEYGAYVELEDVFVEGFVPLEAFGEDRYFFKPRAGAIVGAASKRAFGLGDAVRVRADRVEWDRLRTEFTIVS